MQNQLNRGALTTRAGFAGMADYMVRWLHAEDPAQYSYLEDYVTAGGEEAGAESGPVVFWASVLTANLLIDWEFGTQWLSILTDKKAKDFIERVKVGGDLHEQFISGTPEIRELDDSALDELVELALPHVKELPGIRDLAARERDYLEYLETIANEAFLEYMMLWDSSGEVQAVWSPSHYMSEFDPATVSLWGAGAIALAVVDRGNNLSSVPDGQYPPTVSAMVREACHAAEQLSGALLDNGALAAGRWSYKLSHIDDESVVIGSKLDFTLTMATCLVYLESAVSLASAHQYAEAFLRASAVARTLLDHGCATDRMFSGYLSGGEGEQGLSTLRDWFESIPAMATGVVDWGAIRTEVEALSFVLEREIEQRLLASAPCPVWMVDELDYWAIVDAPPDSVEDLALRRDTAAIKSDLLDRKAQGGSASRFPRIGNTMAFQMLKWAADILYVDYFDTDGLLRRLDANPGNRSAAAGLFWTSQCLLENGLLDPDHAGNGILPEWDEVHRLLLGPDWEQGVALMHWDQILRFRENPMLQADAFLDWAEPLAERDPATVVMYGATVLSLLVSAARGRAGEEGTLYYDEDLRRVFGIVAEATRLVDLPYFLSDNSDEWTYFSPPDNKILGDSREEFSISCARLLADVERAAMLAANHEYARALGLAATAVGNMLDDGVLVDGLYIPRYAGPFASGASEGAFADIRSWFEEGISSPTYIEDQGSVSDHCWVLHAYLKRHIDWLHDNQCDVPEWELEQRAYWDQAEKLVAKRLSPEQFGKALVRHQEETHRVRLSRDVLHDTWDVLDRRTQNLLVTMERNWYEGLTSPGVLADVPNELRKIFELELQLCLEPLRDAIEGLLRDRHLSRELGLHSRSFTGLLLGDMSRLLRLAGDEKDLRALALRTAFESLPVNDQDRVFLTKHLVDYIKPLWSARNRSEHEFRWSTQEIALHRRAALGIDRWGFLPRLLRIKRKITGIPSRAQRGAGMT